MFMYYGEISVLGVMFRPATTWDKVIDGQTDHHLDLRAALSERLPSGIAEYV